MCNSSLLSFATDQEKVLLWTLGASAQVKRGFEVTIINTLMKHIHHIIPKHMGGSDDPANLTELSVEEHAEAHRLLYEQHGQ